MPRVPEVSRTMTVTVCKVLCLDLSKRETHEIQIMIPRSYRSDLKVMEKVRMAIQDPQLKPAHLIDRHTEVIQFTMTEQAYINNATIKNIISNERNQEQ